MSVFNIIVVGNLTRDPEVLETRNGNSMTRFSIACNNAKKLTSKEYGPVYCEIAAFGNNSKFAANYLSKGQNVTVVGPMKVVDYEKKDGTIGTKYEVIADQLSSAKQHKANNAEEGFTADQIPF